MSKAINLRQYRKAKARDDKRRQGDANAAVSGLSKAQKIQAERENSRFVRDIDGKALQRPSRDTEPGTKMPAGLGHDPYGFGAQFV